MVASPKVAPNDLASNIQALVWVPSHMNRAGVNNQ